MFNAIHSQKVFEFGTDITWAIINSNNVWKTKLGKRGFQVLDNGLGCM